MAKMITRTVTTTVVEAVICNKITREVITAPISIPGNHMDDDQKKLNKLTLAAMDECYDQFALVSAAPSHVKEEVLGIPEAFFIANAVPVQRGKKEEQPNE